MLRTVVLLIGWLGATVLGPVVLAPAAPPETVLKNLHRPCGIAVRPGGTADRYELFIADSGAGRVVRWSTAAPKETADAITGFNAAADFDRFAPQGPLALWFLDPELLLVGMADVSTDRLIRSYELPEDDRMLSADAENHRNSSATQPGAATCLAITRSRVNEFVPDALLLAVRSGNGGLLLRARVQAGIVGNPKPFGGGESSTSPRAVATSPAGRFVVADQQGQLVFYNPIDGNVEMRLSTDLKQLVGLAYSPTSGSLYAADFDQGIYRIDDASQPGRTACRTVQIAEVHQPSALAFAPDGALYFVTFGTGSSGTLQVLTSDL